MILIMGPSPGMDWLMIRSEVYPRLPDRMSCPAGQSVGVDPLPVAVKSKSEALLTRTDVIPQSVLIVQCEWTLDIMIKIAADKRSNNDAIAASTFALFSF